MKILPQNCYNIFCNFSKLSFKIIQKKALNDIMSSRKFFFLFHLSILSHKNFIHELIPTIKNFFKLFLSSLNLLYFPDRVH